MSTIYFTPRAMAKLQAYVSMSDGEVSGIGRVERLDSEDFLITEIILLEQESGWASTELDDEALTGFLEELISKGEDPGAYKLWWHSHGNAPVYWSVTDDETCRRFQNRWMLSVVVNKRGECKGRIDVYEPIHLAGELPVRIYTPLEEGELEAIKEELQQKVRRKTWSYSYERGRWPWRRWREDEEGEEQALEDRDRGSTEAEEGDRWPWTS